jgi:myo-inositol-1(or 4)-monophosphatase
VPSREALREVALRAARAAGEVVSQHAVSGTAVAAEEKSAGDYVTAVDHEAEERAVGVLSEQSDIPVLAEERGGSLAERVWVVDPVDGTTNLVRAFPVVGVSVALMEAGRPVVAAITAPLLGAEWSAVEGLGARDRTGKPIAVSAHGGRGVVATGFPFRRKERLPRYLPILSSALREFEDLRRAGAASLDLAYTAQGSFDGFFELGLGLWDIAAGALLVREAGGVVTDWNGDSMEVFRSGDILAGAPAWHERMLSLLT